MMPIAYCIRRSARFLVMTCLLCLLWVSTIPAVYAMGGSPPALGEVAPEFTLSSNGGGGDVSLSDYKGQWVVVYFYPKDFTAGCTIEAQRFQKDLPSYLDRGVQILGISADSINSHAEFCDAEGLRFPLLADTDGSVSKAYGSWMGFVSARHTFIIDPDGILREQFLGVHPTTHSAEVLSRLDELQEAPQEVNS